MTNKKWYKSKTKWGALLVGLSAVFGTLGGWFSGSIDFASAIAALVAEVGVVMGVLGIRDLPFVNKK